MSKKQIGIPGWIGSGMFGVTQPYAEFISRFGNLVILSPNDDIRSDLDMLILPGGADVAPSRYAENISFYTGSSNPHLEYFDEVKLPDYIENKTPIISICRGSQSIWTMFGGTMIQHNPYHVQSDYPKHEVHELAWSKPEYALTYGQLIGKVNSRHHQSMDGREGLIPEGIEVIAYAKEEDGFLNKSIVEIFKHKELPIFGYQGHPEDMPNDRLTPFIINEFLNK